MFGEEKKLKDTTSSSSPLQGEGRGEVSLSQVGGLSYTKTDKLITALYMVTDIMDKDEPLRNKLRTLGTGIISDMHLIQQNNTGYTMSFISVKISEIMSFLDIASAVNIISGMNCNILRKEFSLLNKSISEFTEENQLANKRINLAEFLREDEEGEFSPLLNKEGVGGGNSLITTLSFSHSSSERGSEISKGHTSLGVQKGSTLLKALNGVKGIKSMSDRKTNHSADMFDALKKQRENSIINIVKTMSGGATIKDIKDRAKAMPGKADALISCSEKTLQRELVSMVKNGVLDKMGEKRWSRYFLK